MAVGGQERRTRRSLSNRLPILGWLPRYSRGALRGDLTAGVAVTALIVPKNLGYAGIAGIPLQNGLYAAAAGALLYPLFCTSRHISTGPSSSLAAVAGGAVLVTGIGGEHAAELVAAISAGNRRAVPPDGAAALGWIARFLSKAVITGFLAGAAIDVVIGELPKLTATSTEGDNAWRELSSGSARWVAHMPRRSSSGSHPWSWCWACASSPPGRRGRWFWWWAVSSPHAARARQPRGRARGSCSERPAVARTPRCLRVHGPRRGDRHRRDGTAADRLLADGRRRTRICGPAPVPHRREPGVDRTGHGERRRRLCSRGCPCRPACRRVR